MILNFASQSTFNMNNSHYLEQLSEIKSIMENRTKFHSLSGVSGVLAGCYALIAAGFAYKMLRNSDSILYNDILLFEWSDILVRLMVLSIITLGAAIMTGLYYSTKRAKSSNTTLWTPAAKKVFKNFSIPFGTGSIFVISLILNGYVFLVAPASLIFYGMSLINAANYTFSEVKSLGIIITVIGLINLFIPGYGLLFWAFGFGVMHIIYGLIMYFKYER